MKTETFEDVSLDELTNRYMRNHACDRKKGFGEKTIETFVFNGDKNEKIDSQIRPIETIDFTKGRKTFRYLNKNRRWEKKTIDIGAEKVFLFDCSPHPSRKF